MNSRGIPFVDLKAQYQAISPQIHEAILGVMENTSFILGEDVSLFEQEFASYCGAEYAVGVDNGTAAIELALRAFGIGPGDEVITAANSYIATAFAISATGAAPVLVDMDQDTFGIDVSQIAAVISEKTRAIIPVHLYGHPADMDPIMSLAEEYDLAVIEDACQAHGARYRGQRVGSIGHAAAFSFYPAKNLGAYGDGGMVVTNLEHIAESVRVYRNQGQERKNVHPIQAHNHRLDSIQAAVLRVKLPYLDGWNEARRRVANMYTSLLRSVATVPETRDYAQPVFHLYVIRIGQRDAVRDCLAAQGISTGIHYPTPIHLQPAYHELGLSEGEFPLAERTARDILSLPMYPEMQEESVRLVAEAITNCVDG